MTIQMPIPIQFSIDHPLGLAKIAHGDRPWSSRLFLLFHRSLQGLEPGIEVDFHWIGTA